ncbi:hypothetical protein F5X99DRAFT_63244 [Biscogniauxia marginata]|nr:hypothetical protein F5X99DRAFT_63244 [Biscogniauxia marginata]
MPRTRTPRCQKCCRQHHKCTYSQPDVCDNCLKTGTECRPMIVRKQLRPLKDKPLPLRHSWHVKKCDRCRRGHMRCEPNDRVWPDKCHRCLITGYQCSPARTGQEQLEYDAGILGQQKQPPTSTMPLPHLASSFELESSSDSDSSASIPAKLPERPNPERIQEAKDPKLTAQLKSTIQEMEAEFAEVLKSEQARFDKSMSELRAKHEQELRLQRERYEARIDDLIQIMKKIR